MFTSFFTRHCAVTPARFSLACAFPPAEGLNGACTTMADLSRHGIIRPLFTPTKAAAVRLVIERNMQAVESDGKGNEARRRAERQHLEDEASEVLTEGQRFPSNPNPHDD